MIAVLFAQKYGVYHGLPDIDLWDKPRDARQYKGPWPVVAHPPCARWGRYWYGGPTLIKTREYLKKGDDEGCFAAALAAVRNFGGVLEHPEASHAWRHFGLLPPLRCGEWSIADWQGGWTCCVEQGWYGHRARKPTWLYAKSVELPSLRWGHAKGNFLRLDDGSHSKEERRGKIKLGTISQLPHREREATPVEFRDVLIAMALSVNASHSAVCDASSEPHSSQWL